MTGVSESLAGRIGFVHMGPFCLPELKPALLDHLWLRGGFPDGGILDPEMFPDWQRDYLQALVARDLPNWGLPSKPRHKLSVAAPYSQNIYYFRTSDGYELDLLLEIGGKRWAVEIKLTSNPSSGDIERLQKTAAMIDADRAILVCRIARTFENDKLLVANLPAWLRRINNLAG